MALTRFRAAGVGWGEVRWGGGGGRVGWSGVGIYKEHLQPWLVETLEED